MALACPLRVFSLSSGLAVQHLAINLGLLACEAQTIDLPNKTLKSSDLLRALGFEGLGLS